MNAKIRGADVKWDFNFFVIITNVFVSITKAVALFVLILVIMVILIMFHDKWNVLFAYNVVKMMVPQDYHALLKEKTIVT